MTSDIQHINDIESVFADWSDWEYEIQQLAGGPIGFGRTSISLGDVLLTWEWADKPMRVRLQLPGDTISVSMILAGDRMGYWKGHEVSADQVLVFGTAEHDYFLPPAFQAVNISTSVSAIVQFGLSIPAGGLWKVRPWHISRLRTLCAAAHQGRANADALRSGILCALADLFRSPECGGECSEPPVRAETHRHRVLRLSEDLGLQLDQTSPIAQLADSLSISTRTLHRTVKGLSGLSPKQYLDVLRLHRFRKDLLKIGQSQTITSLAFDHGFEHVGRMSRFYRDWYGELPREARQRQI